MKKAKLHIRFTLLLCTVLIAVTALLAAGCAAGSGENPDTDGSGEVTVLDDGSGEVTVLDDGSGEVTVLGDGETSFALTVVDGDGRETAFTIHTDADTVGDALLELGLIEGEEGDFGLYVKTVNGITADYDTDGTYWAFYINGEYAVTGVDATGITDGAAYTLQVEK